MTEVTPTLVSPARGTDGSPHPSFEEGF
jgi:hypothetical protein